MTTSTMTRSRPFCVIATGPVGIVPGESRGWLTCMGGRIESVAGVSWSDIPVLDPSVYGSLGRLDDERFESTVAIRPDLHESDFEVVIIDG